MKTAHELARELLELPDLEIIVEGWSCGSPYETDNWRGIENEPRIILNNESR